MPAMGWAGVALATIDIQILGSIYMFTQVQKSGLISKETWKELWPEKKKFIELRVIRRTGANPKLIAKQEEDQAKYTVKEFVLNWYTNYIERHRKQPQQIKQHINSDPG